jgi:hypothetical protein
MTSVERALELSDAWWSHAPPELRTGPGVLQAVHLVGQLDFEVNLGGLLGWLTNSSGGYGAETVVALDDIGAHRCAMILRTALMSFPDGKPAKDGPERTRQIQSLLPAAAQSWRQAGDALLASPDDVAKLLEAYVTRHVGAFASLPVP